jgi:hypothetical protein
MIPGAGTDVVGRSEIGKGAESSQQAVPPLNDIGQESEAERWI